LAMARGAAAANGVAAKAAAPWLGRFRWQGWSRGFRARRGVFAGLVAVFSEAGAQRAGHGFRRHSAAIGGFQK
jgi:hypothetical protein